MAPENINGKTLKDLFSEIPVTYLSPEELPDLAISNIVLDSRQVQPGTLFVALTGGNTDGHKYIPAAVERGAAAVVGSRPGEEIHIPVPYIQVLDARFALAHLSAAFFGFPARDLVMIGVTGTDGKTTTSNIIYQILLAAGLKAGIISTVNAVIGDEIIDTGFHVTTPEAPEVQYYLSRMRDAGITHVVLETTSHGLAQDRVTACDFDIAVVTNITHEHLDYHGSYEGYRAAKGRLFQFLESSPEKKAGIKRLAVLNAEDGSFDYLDNLVKSVRVTKLSYGLARGDIRAKNLSYHPSGLRFEVKLPDRQVVKIESSLVGDYNVSNILAAIGATVIGLEIPVMDAYRGIQALRAIPGRMERIDLGQNFTAIVDFAHTPNALKRALEAARKMTDGKVIAVFGSAGLRDREKRRLMAEESARLADISILTAEDPRTESLDAILEEMSCAAEKTGGIDGQTYYRVPDRGEALRMAVRLAQPGDLVISCGKGHEQSMCFGETEYHWDDRTALKSALAELLGLSGYEPMPYLPTQG